MPYSAATPSVACVSIHPFVGSRPRNRGRPTPTCRHHLAPVGETPILFETPGRHNHTMLSYITRSPRRHDLHFHDGFAVPYFSTVFKGAANTEDMIIFLTGIHHYYRGNVMILWDHLSAHHAAESYFEETHPHWFDFHYFPSYSPELNPVEPCWNQIKKVYLSNFVPTSDEELVSAVWTAGERIGEENLLPSLSPA